jgi:hypothetical protein
MLRARLAAEHHQAWPGDQDFERDLPPTWLVTCSHALACAVEDEVKDDDRGGSDTLHSSLLGLFGPDP